MPFSCNRLSQQLYVEQHQQATSRLSDLDKQFEAAVANVLGITADQQPQLLAEALQAQQQLQEVQVGGCTGSCCTLHMRMPACI
jgi:hypothetical protein